MQQLGYVEVHGEKIKVLARPKVRKLPNGKVESFYVSLKIRKSGEEENFLIDESRFLEDEPEKVKNLKDGKVIAC